MNINTYINPNANTVTGIAGAVALNNKALQLSKAGDHESAAELYQQAIALKIQTHGPDSIQVALSRNALGEELLQIGRLDEAEAELTEAIKIREAGGPSAALDAAVSRENLAQAYEVKREWQEARNVRFRNRDQMVCSNYDCPGQIFKASEMKQCARCASSYYCSKSCQVTDWRARHKKHCTPVSDQ